MTVQHINNITNSLYCSVSVWMQLSTFHPRVHISDNSTLTLSTNDPKTTVEINILSNIHMFQRSIDNISDRASRWQLKLASTRCYIIRVSFRKCNPTKYSHIGSTVDLPKFTIVTDLDIRIDSRLSFSNHLDHVVSQKSLKRVKIR